MPAAQEALFEEPTLTVAELSAGLGVAVRRAYPDEVWVRGEIANLKRTASTVYFDLTGEGVCLPVVLFDTDRHVVNRILVRAGGMRMVDGTEVRLRARVQWFPRRGTVSLRMLSIDPTYTLGRLTEERELLLQRLHADGTVGRNARLSLPPVPLRVGIVTSVGSAAEADVLRTFEASGFGWQVVVADARVQGADADRSVAGALRALAARGAALDVVCVVRGGGARTELATFDSEGIARAIAAMPVPVFTGIGHEIDTTVADVVAHQAHKTPTACAGALVAIVTAYLDRVDAGALSVVRAARVALDRSASRLEQAGGVVAGSARHHLRRHHDRTMSHAGRIATWAPRLLQESERTLDALTARVDALDPARVLARGWSITRMAGGRLVRRRGDTVPGDTIVTTVSDGTIGSTVSDG